MAEMKALVSLFILISLIALSIILVNTANKSYDKNVDDFNGSLYFASSCPKIPDCNAFASCSCHNERVYEACHLPPEIFERHIYRQQYIGFSNVPTFFSENVFNVIDVKGKEDLFVGCFYGFTYEGGNVVHRLLAIYPSYLLFRGDNNEGTERVTFDKVNFLVVGVIFS